MDVADEALWLLGERGAHLSFGDVLRGLRARDRFSRPRSAPYSVWSLVEHMRITQWDILRYITDPDHQSSRWPEGYWNEPSALSPRR